MQAHIDKFLHEISAAPTTKNICETTNGTLP